MFQNASSTIRERPKLSNDRRILHILVGPGLIELMRTQSGSRCRAVRLNGIAFVQQIFLVQLLQQPPDTFNVFVLIGHIRRLHIHPVSHFVGELIPDIRITHHRLSASFIVFFDGQFDTDVFLGDSEFLFDTQFNRQSMGIPTRFAFHAVPFEGVKPAKNIFDCTGHHVVNSRFAIG